VEDPPLKNKIALVTGAGSRIGMGRAIALALVRAGARVAILDVDASSLEQSAADVRAIGGDDCVFPIVADITQPEAAARAVQQTIANLGGLHVLFNHAGINPRIDYQPGLRFTQIPPAIWARTVDVNGNGPFYMAQAATGHMLEQGWGRIIGTTTSLDTMLNGMPYGPSKTVQEAFMTVLAAELDRTGVTANLLNPGGSVDTNFTRHPGEHRERGDRLAPEVVQAPAVWLASEASNGYNGRRLTAAWWDEELPLPERIEKASGPAGWRQPAKSPTGS
jgi:NAD(P)-dependent dehydrogenase (short-subunit alcohol dehydrogenase family)